MNTGSGPCLRPWPPWSAGTPARWRAGADSVREINADAWGWSGPSGRRRGGGHGLSGLPWLDSEPVLLFPAVGGAGGAAGSFYLHHGGRAGRLLPRLGLEPALYAALDSYYQAGSPAGSGRGWCSAPSTAASAGIIPSALRARPGGRGCTPWKGFLPPEREAGYRTRMAAGTRPVIGVLIHDHYARTGNLEQHVDALLRAIQARGQDSIRPSLILRRRPRGRSRASSTGWSGSTAGRTAPPFRGRWCVSCYGFSLTTLARRKARAGQVPASVFENWGLPVIQGLTTYFSADEYRRDIRGLDLVLLPVCVYQPELTGSSFPCPTRCRRSGRRTGGRCAAPCPTG